MRTFRRVCFSGIIALTLFFASHAMADLYVGNMTTLSISGVGFIVTKYSWNIIQGGTSLDFTATGDDTYKAGSPEGSVATVIGRAEGTAVIECYVIGYRLYYDYVLKEIENIPMIDTRKFTIQVVSNVTSLSVTPASCNVLTGETQQLSYSVLPTTAAVTWSSSDATVASVSSSGLVSAYKSGTANITVTAGQKSATSAVKVKWRYPVTSMQFKLLSRTIYMEDTPIQTLPVIVPATSAAGTLEWSTSASEITTVTNGFVTPKSLGSAVITASLSGVSASQTVTVAYRYPVDNITLNKSTATLYMEDGDTLNLLKEVSPVTSALAAGVWSSSNTSVAIVDTQGMVMPKAAGTASISYTANGKTAVCALTVAWRYPVTSLAFINNVNTIKLAEGSVPMLVTVLPESCANAPLTWTSSDTSVLTVSGGVLRPIKGGIATITVASKNGKKISRKMAVLTPEDPGYRLVYTTGAGGITITGWIGTLQPSLALPSVYDGQPVAAIAASAFKNATTLVSVKVPKSVQTIGSGAFGGCTSLVDITLPFVGGSRLEIYDKSTFGYIFGLGSSANGGTFQLFACSYYWDDDKLGDKEGTYYAIPASLRNVTITDATRQIDLQNCGKLTNVRINQGVKNLGWLAFAGANSLTSVTLPPTLQNIDYYAFCANTGLTSITLPASVKEIGVHAFDGCTNLLKQGTLVLPYGLTTIDKYAFLNCSGIKTMVVPSSVTYIDATAFTGCTSLTLHVVKDSYAHTFAVTKKIPFILSDPIQTLTLSQTALTIYKDEKPMLIVSTIPAGRQVDIAWQSSNPDVVTVDAQGNVIPVSSGMATLTCMATDGGPASATCQVQVMLGIQQIMLQQGTLQMTAGESTNFSYTIQPDRYQSNPVRLASSDETVARFNADGRLFAISPGTATVSVIAADAETMQSDCIVTVAVPKVLSLPVATVHISARTFQNGTSIQSVDLRGTAIISIGASAFNGCTELLGVSLPATVTAIDDTAFSGCSKVSFFCPAGSYAATYARAHGIPFIEVP